LYCNKPKTGLQSPRISVLLCSYNRPDKVKLCLNALENQTLPAEQFEVICVNDGSQDEETRRVMLGALERLPGAYEEHSFNKGLAAARNTAIRMARGDYFLFINDDTIADPDLLEQHLKTQLSNAAARMAVLGSFDFSPELLERSAVLRAFTETALIFAYAELSAGQSYNYMKFWTCNVSVPRDAWQRAGDFDEAFSYYGAEDTEWGYRLEKNGYRVLYAPWARARHEHDMSSVSGFCLRQQQVASNFLLLFRAHPETIWPSLLTCCRSMLSTNLAALESEHEKVLKQAEHIAGQDLTKISSVSDQEYLVSSLKPLLQWLHKYHWSLGFLKGLEALNIESFQQIPNLGRNPESPDNVKDESRTLQGKTYFAMSNDRQKHSSPIMSVVIPTYNRAQTLQKCLRALAVQELPCGTFEIVVVDDGSSDNTPEIVQQARSPFEIHYVRQENSGPAAARNRGIDNARGELILILNDDAIVCKDLVAGHYLVHRKKCECKQLAVLGTREYRIQDKLRVLNFLYDQVPLSMRVYGLQEGFLPAPYFVTFNVSFLKSDFVAVGGFDEDFRSAIGEDSEFGTRWQNTGGSILFSPDLRAYHDHDVTVDGLKGMIIREAFNGLILFHKHRTLWRPKGTEILLKSTSEMRSFTEEVGTSMRLLESIMREYENQPIWELEGGESQGVRIDSITDFVIAVRKMYPQFYSYVTMSHYLTDSNARAMVKRWIGPDEIIYLTQHPNPTPAMHRR